MSRERPISFSGMRWTLVTGILLAATLCSTAVAPASPSDLGVDRRAQLEAEIAGALNDVRAARGLPALRPTPGLRAAAAAHSRAMLSRGFFTHESLDGTPFHQRIRRHYPARGWHVWSVGETLLASSATTDARAVVEAWLHSRDHREIMLSRSWREVGVGAFFRADAPGEFGGVATLVVTADFGYRAGKRTAASRP